MGEEKIVDKSVYTIKFRLGKSVFERGIDPRFYIDDLREIGDVEVRIIKEDIPSPDEEVTEVHGFYADVILKTEKSEREIREVLEFILEDGVEIVPVSVHSEDEKKGGEKKYIPHPPSVPETLLKNFLTETEELLASLESTLLRLEENPADWDLVNEAFRIFHTLKGNTGLILSYGPNRFIESMKELSHVTESFLQKVRDEHVPITQNQADLLFEVVDAQKSLMKLFQGRDVDEVDIGELIRRVKEGSEEKVVRVERLEAVDVDKKAFFTVLAQYKKVFLEILKKEEKTKEDVEFLKRAVNTLRDLSLESEKKVLEELSEAVISEDYEKAAKIFEDLISLLRPEKKESKKRHLSIETESHIKVDQSFVDNLMNLVSELVISKEWFNFFSAKLDREYGLYKASKEMKDHLQRFARLVEDIQSMVLDLRMVPVSTIFERFKRLVRDMSRQFNKKINLLIVGGDTKIDKVILDKLGDPLIHLIRNAVDHGIEHEDERVAIGKPSEGTIELKAYYSPKGAVVEVKDDGRGIDIEKVKSKALEKGIVEPEQLSKMEEKEIFSLIFAPGFSTKDEITDISGRGVGMDVVSTTVSSFGGNVEVESKQSIGTKISLFIPTNIAVRKILVFSVSDILLSLPLESIEETIKIENNIKRLKGKPVIDHRGKIISIVDLAEVLSLNEVRSKEDRNLVILKDRDIAVCVDRIVGRMDTVIKPLPNLLRDLKEFQGISILGDGSIVFNLNPNIFNSF